MHHQEIKYPIGIQTFSEIRDNGYIYVDKTRFIHSLAHTGKYYFLSRPRRFGKSLLLSTLQAYFEGRRELFDGLEIDRLETKWDVHPVIRIDLSAADYGKPEALINKIKSYLDEMEEEFGVSSANSVYELPDRFRKVIKAAYAATGARVVVLVDEYDKPMLDSLLDTSIHGQHKATLRSFYSVLKECDAYIRFAMLTGITKFEKVSIFSGLNNLRDISLNPDYNEICGISESEFQRCFRQSVKVFAEKHSISKEETLERFKAFYDGYHFSYPATDIYNPFSTLNAFADHRMKAYWFTSGSSNYLVSLIKHHQFALQSLEGAKRTEAELNDITTLSHDVVPLLYQAGYLTIKNYDEAFDTYTLGFPNKEVSQGFWSSLSNYFFRRTDMLESFSLQDFTHDLLYGNADRFMLRMQSLFASISSENEPNKEVHFRNMLTIFVKMLGFKVSAELHSSQGRCDIHIATPQFIYILELKIDASPEMALSQIEEKGYARQYAIDSREKILIGANFSKYTRTLTGWLIYRQPNEPIN